ncbi:hypothetical protein BGW38_007537, partial [Lunasporangiospora selenospora]
QDASRASSIRGIGATSSASTISESGQSESSLGGLNHVNDGVQGSTTQRRMSRVYSSHDDLLAQGQNQGHARGHSENSIHRRNPAIAEEPGHNNNNQDDNDDDDDDGPSPGERKSESCWKTWLRKRVPAYGWLISPGYNYHELPDDLIAGIMLQGFGKETNRILATIVKLAISTVVIPQSMAYAMLAQLPPVYGLYTSVVPILVYCIFGTSRHMHTGTFAITTLLLGQAVRGLIADRDSSSGRQGNPPTLNDYNLINVLFYEPSPLPPPEDSDQEQYYIGMILMLSLVIGVVQVIMAFMRVGGWASKHLLPDALVGGFNTAAVFHIGTSQLKHFLGLKGEPKLQGAFALIKSWIWIGSRFWSDTNWYTVTLGTTAILFMLALRSLEKKRKAKYELKLRAKEMQSVQQRQAVSAAIVRDHEERRLQQQAWLQQHQQKQATEAFPSSSTTTRDPTTVPFFDSNSSTGGAASTISLRTVPDEDGNRRPTRGSGVNSRSPSEAEQATMDAVVSAAVVAKEERQVYVPIPDILLAVIVMTLLTVFFSLDTPRSEGGFGIAVIGTIPKGLPQIAFPPSLITTGGAKEWMTWEFVTEVVLPMIQPALLIAVIIYVMSYSIGKQFGKRYGYKVDADQEMLALGLASIIGSSFSGYACTGSLTRTAILSQSGGKTPLASIVGVVTVVLTLIYLTWCFERVPNAVLAAIVLIALQSL